MKLLQDNEQGLRFLVIEDEALLAMYVEDLLLKLGCQVMKAGRIEKAWTLLRGNSFAGAFLDVSIGGTTVFPLVSELRKRDVPFAFMTGYEADQLPAEYKDDPILTKPIAENSFAKIVATFAAHARDRHESDRPLVCPAI